MGKLLKKLKTDESRLEFAGAVAKKAQPHLDKQQIIDLADLLKNCDNDFKHLKLTEEKKAVLQIKYAPRM